MTFTISPSTPFSPASNRKPKRDSLTPHEAKLEAIRLLRDQSISPIANKVIDLLAVAGVLTDQQMNTLINVALRSRLRYYKQHILDRLPIHTLDLDALGLPCSYVYALGAVGLEIAALRHDLVPTGYIGYGVHRITHDLLCNQVAISVLQAAAHHGWTPSWRSRYEATVHDDDGRPVLEPDAMLVLEAASGARRQFVVEYHNEDTSRRAATKIAKYERAFRDGNWQQEWGTDVMPLVLVSWTHNAVATGYKAAIEEAARLGLRCTYLGKPWSSVIQNSTPGMWKNFRTGEVVNVLEVASGE